MGDLLLGIGLLAIGATLLYMQRKRRFKRTNSFGVETFASYSSKLRVKVWDSILIGCSLLCLTVGSILVGLHYESSWGWIILLPVYAVTLWMFIGL